MSLRTFFLNSTKKVTKYDFANLYISFTFQRLSEIGRTIAINNVVKQKKVRIHLEPDVE